MTISLPPNPEMSNHLDFVVQVSPPNDNTDGQDCPCGHAGAAHRPVEQPDTGETTWQCQHCACTRAPAHV